MPNPYNNDQHNALVIDTNVLLYLFQPNKHADEVFNRFLSNILFLQADLVVTSQIIKEWNRHKERNYERFLDEITHSISEHENIVSYIENEEDKKEIISTLNTIKKMEIRKYKYLYGKRAEKLDQFLKNDRTIVLDRTSSSDSLVVNFAINKSAPFFSGEVKNGGNKVKNEAADAAIFFTVYDYFRQNNEYDNIYFVTENKKDFSKADNPAAIHENLKPYADEVNMKFFNDVNRALLDFNPEDKFYHAFFSGISTNYLTDNYFVSCPVCKKDVHINADSKIDYRKPAQFQTYLLICECGHTWDTGDFVVDN
ncbi:PIN domain-containing protein [Guptibacillus sedimenti]|uniref:PIN domain-containing protein n=1 Tax=Guptibacillus sedimenti TaxID=3025680 RepID=UPI00235E4945|nr:PIN domain-containing protein [Pseudalkalibacillus sedimenti]